MSRIWHAAIDIGKHGAIAIETSKEKIVLPMPMIKTELDYQKLYQIFQDFEGGNGMVVFEKLGVIFGTSKNTAFSMGHQAGAMKMLCIALSLPFTEVSAKVWQKEMLMGITEITRKSSTGKTQVRDTKAMALLACKNLFPGQKLTFGERAEKPHDGLVDSILMLEYNKRNYK